MRVPSPGSGPSVRTLAVAGAWLAALAGAVSLIIAATAWTTFSASGFPVVFAALALAIVTDASVGAVLVVKRPGNVIGLLLMIAAISIAVTFLGFVIGAILNEERGPSDVLGGFAALIGGLGISPTVILAGPLLALVFPDGRLPGHRWKWPVAAIVAMIIVGSIGAVVRPGRLGGSLPFNPLGVSALAGLDGVLAMGEVLTLAAVPFALVLAIVSVAVRFRRSGAVERQQLKWFVAANAAVGVFLTLSFVDGATNPTIFDILGVASLSLPPVAIGIAILRYRLFEIDRIVSRTIGWAVVTAILAAVFTAVIVGSQAVLAPMTKSSTVAVAVSTLIAAALFQPLRRRVQHAVDRRFDRARYDGQRTVDAFAEQVRNEVDLGHLRRALATTAADSVRPSSATVWLRPGVDVAR